jgi:hypothetical protein
MDQEQKRETPEDGSCFVCHRKIDERPFGRVPRLDGQINFCSPACLTAYLSDPAQAGQKDPGIERWSQAELINNRSEGWSDIDGGVDLVARGGKL